MPDPRNEQLIDQPRAVRDEDLFDIDALDAWLKAHIEGLEGRHEVEQFPKGASNLTYRLRYAGRDLILRRPPAGTKAKSAHDVIREYRIQQALKPAFPKVPRMLAACEDHDVIGSDFYVMERIEGIIPRANMPKGFRLSGKQTRELCRNAIDALIELHSVDVESAGLDQLAKGAGYNRRQIDGWSGRFRKAKTWNVLNGEKVMRWLDRH